MLLRVAATALVLTATATASAATLTISVQDGPGEGLNDPTPAAPVGDNPGTALGQQRLLALQHRRVARDFANAPLPNTWYVSALANARTGALLVGSAMIALGMRRLKLASVLSAKARRAHKLRAAGAR